MALPGHYFRRRGNGALVFRVERDDTLGRLDLRPIATVNQEAGTWTARGGATLTAADEAAMRDWMGAADNRPQGPRERGLKGIGRLADWAQRDAEAAELDEAADEILLAMHDLRQVILRRRGDAG